jgi:hypothetical protein
MNTESHEILTHFNKSIQELKNDIRDVSEKVTRLNTILEGAGGGGLIGDLKKIEVKVTNMEIEMRQEINNIKKKIWQFAGAVAVISSLAAYVLPKLFA